MLENKQTQFIHKIWVYLVLAQDFLPLVFESLEETHGSLLFWAVSQKPLLYQAARCPQDSSDEPHSQGAGADVGRHLVQVLAGGAKQDVPMASS